MASMLRENVFSGHSCTLVCNIGYTENPDATIDCTGVDTMSADTCTFGAKVLALWGTSAVLTEVQKP